MQASHRDALMRHNKQVPRYTSYPTAPHFNTEVNSDTVKVWLSEIRSDKPISLYFHIPFCKKLCWYCGCNTKATKQYNPVKSFLNDLLREIEIVCANLPVKASVEHIHFGGGSPSLLSPEDFTLLVDHIKQHFDVLPRAEIAIELDPRETTEAKIAAYSVAGVTRASLGIQDFDKTVQKAINRVQPFHRVYGVVKTLREYGIEAINFDLLYGLPYQTTESINDTISLTAALKPERVSLFGYAHVPWMKKHMRLIDEMKLPGAEERIEQYGLAQSKLKAHGYNAIGIDHFALPNDKLSDALKLHKLHRNFQGYTTDEAETLLGFGPSAISAFPQGYAQNTTEMRKYTTAVTGQKLATAKGIQTSENEKMRRSIISNVMCYGEVDLAAVRDKFDLPLAYFENEIKYAEALINDGLAQLKDNILTVNPTVPQARRLIASLFDTFLHPVSDQHSQVA